MAKQNFSVARIETRTRATVGKFERHIERKNDSYENMNVDLSRTPIITNPSSRPVTIRVFLNNNHYFPSCRYKILTICEYKYCFKSLLDLFIVFSVLIICII